MVLALLAGVEMEGSYMVLALLAGVEMEGPYMVLALLAGVEMEGSYMSLALLAGFLSGCRLACPRHWCAHDTDLAHETERAQ